jgi:hypothetical protein
MLGGIKLNGTMLSVVMLNVTLLSVIAPFKLTFSSEEINIAQMKQKIQDFSKFLT